VIWAVGQSAEPFLADYLEREFGSTAGSRQTRRPCRWLGTRPVFAGRDIVRGAGTVVQAVADGRRAAKGIHRPAQTT